VPSIPCYPSKVAVAHVHNLIFKHHAAKPLHAIFLPIRRPRRVPRALGGVQRLSTASATPLAVAAAFRGDSDAFASNVHPKPASVAELPEYSLLARQMHDCWAPLLGLDDAENARAVELAIEAQRRWLRPSPARSRCSGSTSRPRIASDSDARAVYSA